MPDRHPPTGHGSREYPHYGVSNDPDRTNFRSHGYAAEGGPIERRQQEEPVTSNQGPVLLDTMRARASTRRGWVEATVEELQTLTGIDYHDVQKVLRQWRGMSLVKFTVIKRGGSEVITAIRFTPAGLRYEYPADRNGARVAADNGTGVAEPIPMKAFSQRNKGTTPEQVAEIVKMRDGGAQFQAIGKHFGFSGENARYLYQKAKVKEATGVQEVLAEAEASVAIDSPAAGGAYTAKPSESVRAVDLAGTEVMAMRVLDLEAERDGMGARVTDLEREKANLQEQLRRAIAATNAEAARVRLMRAQLDEARAAKAPVAGADPAEHPLITALVGREERLLNAAANIEADAPDLAEALVARAQETYSPLEREVLALLERIGLS